MKYQTTNKIAHAWNKAQEKQSEILNCINLCNFEHCKALAFKLDDNTINKFEFNIYNRKLDGSISVGMGSWLFRLMK